MQDFWKPWGPLAFQVDGIWLGAPKNRRRFFFKGVANLFFQRCGYKAFLLRRQNTTNVTRIAATSLQKRRESRTSRLHDSKNDDRLAFHACANPKATNVPLFAPARLQKQRMSRISRVHDSKTTTVCTTQKTTTVSQFACTNQKATNVPDFAPARLRKQRKSRIFCEHGSKSAGPRISRMSRLQTTTAVRI